MLERPTRLRFAPPKSALVWQTRYWITRPGTFFICVGIFSLVPYVSVRTYKWIDDTGYWERRIEKKRVKKMAFDYMLKSQADKERDLIEEYADF